MKFLPKWVIVLQMSRIYKGKEISILKEGGKKLAIIVKKLSLNIKEGKTAKELEYLAINLIKKAGGSPSFLNYRSFPGAICISVNEEVVHNVPTAYRFKKGDIVSIDVGLKYKSFHTDMAVTVPVGKISQEKRKFLNVCQKALDTAIEVAKPGVSLGTIGNSIQSIVEKEGYSVVRELTGHGVGKKLHEPPTVLNYGEKGKGEKLRKGMVIAIEPIINMGSPEIVSNNEEWKISARDKSLSCHFEHTIIVRNNDSLVLTK